MATTADIVNLQITANTTGTVQAGFGTGNILSASAAWVERTRTYTGIDGVAVDFASTTPEYKAAAAMFGQSPRPAKVVISRLANKPTQRRTITPTAVNLGVYRINVAGTAISFTADSSATVAEIVTGLIALINAIPAITLTASGTTTLILTENAAGTYTPVYVADADTALLSLVQDEADPGITADLDAIALEDSSWFMVLNTFASSAINTAVAAWCETHDKMALLMTQDSPVINTVLSGATDQGATLKTAAYKNSAVIFHRGAEFISSAWAGRVLPTDPGSETWALKTLVGVTPSTLTATQRANALAKNVTVYETINGRNITEFGKVASGEYIDITRLILWTKARMGERIFDTLVNNDKMPFTDEGIAAIAGNMRAVLQDGVKVGGYDSFVVTVPKAKDISSADKAARLLSGLNFNAVPKGAAHTVAVKGTVAF